MGILFGSVQPTASIHFLMGVAIAGAMLWILTVTIHALSISSPGDYHAAVVAAYQSPLGMPPPAPSPPPPLPLENVGYLPLEAGSG